MPFDGTLYNLNATSDLVEIAQSLGLNPISMVELEEHKREQIKLHPPSWWYSHHLSVMPALFFGSLITAAVGAAVGISVAPEAAPLIAVGFGGAMGVVVASEKIKLKGLARWETEWHGFLPDKIPTPIREAALKLSTAIPIQFVVGSLYQEKVLLDPYLLAHYQGQLICLGIWDGDKIIACA
jgi:hypothetical protein